jgi:8-oxo-dGTP diphosphatase
MSGSGYGVALAASGPEDCSLPLLVIRHASAGERSEWQGDDRKRPLDEKGRRQAAALVTELAQFPITRILSSPYDRCVQTVEPLAAERGLEIEVRDELGEELQSSEGAALVRSLAGDDVAVCVHGGLSDAAFDEGQKKAETLVVDGEGRVVERVRV